MLRRPIRLPDQWSQHVKSGILDAISLASVALSYARGRATSERQAELDRAEDEIAMLRKELSIKDGRLAPQTVVMGRGLVLRRLGTLSRQLKTLYPTMGSMRIAQTLAREGLRLGTITVRQIVREKSRPTSGAPAVAFVRRRRAVGRDPGHTWHLDLTAVPIRAGHWVPWPPLFVPQRWPFCWCVAVLVDQVSRALVGFAVFHAPPDSKQIQQFLERAIQASSRTPRCIVTDRGAQFWCRCFKRWCKRRGIRPKYGVLGEPFSICIVESFIRSLKQDCTRRLTLVPLGHGAMRRELGAYALWYNRSRPHTHLFGRTPESFIGRPIPRPRFEPRPRMPNRGRPRCRSLELVVGSIADREHLPVIELRHAA